MTIYEIRRAREKRASRLWGAAYLIVFLLGSFAAMNAKANKNEDVCRAYGDIVYVVAERRDEGYSKFEMRKIVLQTEGMTADETEVTLGLVEMVYTRPWRSPETEAELFIEECISLTRYERTSF